MTLVAGLSVGGLPAFVGDLLVSWRLATEVDLPTQSEIGVHPGLDGDHALDLAQKLVIVRPYLMVAWAGVQAEALRIIQALDSALPSTIKDLPDVSLVLEILQTCGQGVELVALVSWPDKVEPYCFGTRGFEIEGKRVYLLGSGGPAFFDYLMAHPPVSEELGDGLAAWSIALRFAAHAFSQQWTTGRGLQESWGGGFEVVYPEPDGFRKVDELLVRAWVVDEAGAYEALCTSFFVKYYGADLYISWFNPEEKTYVVKSPVGKPFTPPAVERVAPTWTLDTFLFKASGKIVDFARYHPRNSGIHDFIELIDGQLAGWSLDQGYVEERLQQAVASVGHDNLFVATRY